MHFFREQAAGSSLGEPRRHLGERGPRGAGRDARRPDLRGRAARQDHDRHARRRWPSELHALREELGLDGILAELDTGGLIPHDCVVNALPPVVPRGQPRVH